ncbi:MAG: 2-C-methyl-D-erythritol 2,4-cyclodiphosphate synthase [Bdellovibrionota bacterium]
MIRIGQGFDTHPFEKDKPLVLGGVTIDHPYGLKGHSDGDALTHAICDALLGALALGDLGQHFSDTDPTNKNRNSMDFLKAVYQKIQARGWKLINVDSTIITEKPKLKDYINEIRSNLSKVMMVPVDHISVKATRPEKMGALGRDEGLAATVVVLIGKSDLRWDLKEPTLEC